MPDAPLNQLVRNLRRTVEAYRVDVLSDAELLERFRSHTDTAAFETIVRRYGERVLAACHKVLSDGADVEDAFQATFLVLLRDARSIRQRDSLGGWLYGVAHRIALQARRRAVRRAAAEARKTSRTAEEAPDLSWREACAILHEELDRLPDKYRLPLLLCYLDGKSRDEAAQQLGVTTDALRGRLERGRDRLRGRLMKRGVALSAGLLAIVANSVSAGGPSSNLIQATLTAAVSQPSPAVAALLHGSTFAMFTGKIRLLGAALLLIGFLATAGVLHSRWPSEPPPPQPQLPAAAPAKEPAPLVADKADPDPADVFTYSGRVLDPDGKPLAGAKIYISGLISGIIEFKPRATTEADGTFRFTVKREEFKVRGNEQPGSRVTIGVTAPNCGAAVAWPRKAEEREKLTLWLPQEQVVTGRILDLEGKPVAGVKVGTSIRSAQWGLDGRPVSFDLPIDKVLSVSNVLPSDPDSAPVVSDKDGRFTIHGLGKDGSTISGLRGRPSNIDARNSSPGRRSRSKCRAAASTRRSAAILN
jgi:RNA polymerase sigma factor (sigma-70 family)